MPAGQGRFLRSSRKETLDRSALPQHSAGEGGALYDRFAQARHTAVACIL